MADLYLDVEAVSDWESLPLHARETMLASHAQSQARLPVEARGLPKDDPRESAALSPWTARVVCVAIWDEAGKRGSCYHDGPRGTIHEGDWTYNGCGSESVVLRATWQKLNANPTARLVTYNGRNYDGPLLMTRSVKHRIPCGRNLVPYRYSTREHLDLCDVLTLWGVQKGVPLDVVAGVLGIPTSKGAMCGADVGRAYLDGRIAEIARYCAGDVDTLKAAHLVWEESVGAVFQERKKWQ